MPHSGPTLASANVDDLGAALVIIIVVEVVIIRLFDRLDASTTQRPLIIELLQPSPRLVLDLPIQLGKRLGIPGLGDTHGALVR